MKREQLQRYSRQLKLAQIGPAGQERLLTSHVLLIGAGGLGSAAGAYLAGLGIGRLTVLDPDVVEISNLHRQLLHRDADAGRPKAESARRTLGAINPQIDIVTVPVQADAANLPRYVQAADVVVDGCDNFATRFAVNAACVAAGRPLVSGAAIRFEGQLTVLRPDLGGPCYRCLYRDEDSQAETCAVNGVLPPVVGVIGALQAMEAVKVLLGLGTPAAGRLLLYDGLAAQWRELRFPRDPACPVCGGTTGGTTGTTAP
ncbi:MAG: molybdopterin-synthase adenylyltransferase MoeB [Pseudomonadota bacterium]|nr:molybdopterin-synthase adenylyltransferase MoeB [Pseudomonadota bacterium]HJO36561.1 molybdopterin-synthase adenylyltransferase MoeB [Gammaproteobacteria bacterium]